MRRTWKVRRILKMSGDSIAGRRFCLSDWYYGSPGTLSRFQNLRLSKSISVVLDPP